MISSSRLTASAADANRPHRSIVTGTTGHRAAGADEVDVQLTQRFNANLLLVGPKPAVSDALARVMPHADRAVVVHRRAERTWLPSTSLRVPTVLAHDIEALNEEGQRALLEWLRATGGHTRVISTASRPLLPLLQAGTFIEELYYRLNTVYIDLT